MISIENMSKVYRISHQTEHADTLRDSLASFLRRKSRQSKASEIESFYALKDISLKVNAGEVLGIIGRNGAGKSTLLKILSRITEPTTGRITLNGRVASLLEVGTGFHPELTGRENIFLNGSILGMSHAEIKKKFDVIVDFSGVEKFLDTPVKRYSSGMYVRLAFAVAAHLEPEILIIDEVLAVGDIEFQNKCLGKMREVSSSGRTVIFVSHQLNSIRQLCDSCCLLKQGEVTATGKPAEVIQQYLAASSTMNHAEHPTQKIFEEPLPINFLKAEIFDYQYLKRRSSPLGTTWQIQSEFEVLECIPNLVVALGITTAQGVAVQTCWSPPSSIKAGKFQATFKQDKVNLECNSYQLILGFSRDNRPIVQIDLGTFDIVHNDDLTDQFIPRSSGLGAVLNSMSTEIKQIAD